MASLNKCMLIGHLGRDPELRYMPDGNAVANYSVATTRKWKTKDGEIKEETEWHRVVAYGRQAEVAGEYLKKGSLVFVEGRLRTRKWQDKEGVDRYTTEIMSDQMTMLDRKPQGGRREEEPGEEEPAPRAAKPAAGSKPAITPTEKKPGKFDDMEDDIPF